MRHWILCGLAALALGACGADDADTGAATDESPTSQTTDPPESSTTTEPPSNEVRAGSIDEDLLGAPFLGDLTFVAPVDCAVPIEEVVLKGGSTAELTYTLSFTATADGTSVAFEDMTVHEIDGQPVPADQQEFAAATFRLPSFVVDSDGLLVEVTGVEELVESIAALDPDIAAGLSTPGLVATIEDLVASKYWLVWVGFWANWAVIEEPVETGVDESRDVEFVVESLGTTDDGLAALRVTSEIEGPQFVEAMQSVIEGILPADATTEETVEALASAQGSLRDRFEVVTDPKTLRPASTYVERDVDLTVDGGSGSQLESRSATFGWDRSDC